MSPATAIRWSGPPMILAGLLIGLFPLLHPNHDPDGYRSAAWVPVHLMPQAGAVLALFGLVGLFARQLRPAGWLGLIGFVTAFVGTALVLTGAMFEAFVIPFLSLEAPHLMETDAAPPGIGEMFLTMSALFTLGYALLGASIVRAGVVPRGAGMLLAFGGPFLMLPGDPFSALLGVDVFPISALPLGLGLAWLGQALQTGTGAQPTVSTVARRRTALGRN